jgi:hypothetical protein
MWCIDAVPLSRQQVTAGLYDLLHPALHRELGLIPSLLPDVMFAYWYASLHFVTCVYYTASTARRTENEGLEKLCKARGVTFPVFPLRGWERKCKTSDQIFGIWDVTQRILVVINRSFGTVYRSHLQGWNNERLQIVRVDIRTLDVTNAEQQYSVLCLFLDF